MVKFSVLLQMSSSKSQILFLKKKFPVSECHVNKIVQSPILLVETTVSTARAPAQKNTSVTWNLVQT